MENKTKRIKLLVQFKKWIFFLTKMQTKQNVRVLGQNLRLNQPRRYRCVVGFSPPSRQGQHLGDDQSLSVTINTIN